MRRLVLILSLIIAASGCATARTGSPDALYSSTIDPQSERGPIQRVLDLPGDAFFWLFPIGRAIP